MGDLVQKHPNRMAIYFYSSRYRPGASPSSRTIAIGKFDPNFTFPTRVQDIHKVFYTGAVDQDIGEAKFLGLGNLAAFIAGAWVIGKSKF
jgi:hypothetical protein